MALERPRLLARLPILVLGTTVVLQRETNAIFGLADGGAERTILVCSVLCESHLLRCGLQLGSQALGF